MKAVDKLNRILAIVERDRQGHHALSKAVVLARHAGAAIELFLCESVAAPGFGLGEGRAYLEALRNFVVSEDVAISIDVARTGRIPAGLLHKIGDSRPDLVVKQIGGMGEYQALGLSAADGWLIESSPAPLFLTRGRPWSPLPRFAVLAAEGSWLADSAGFLARICRARLDLVDPDRRPEAPSVQNAAMRQYDLMLLDRDRRALVRHLLASFDCDFVLMD